MKLTRQLIHDAGKSGVGFNRAQLTLLGVAWPPRKGWLTEMIGMEVREDVWALVMQLRGVRKKHEREKILLAALNTAHQTETHSLGIETL